MASMKRKYLTLEEKLGAIKLLDKGTPAYKVAESLGVGKTQIQNLRKRKIDVLDEVESNVSMDSKRRRRCTGNENKNDLTYEWFKTAVSRRIPVTGPLLQAKALEFASQLQIQDFKASKGWLQSFNKRNNISFGSMSGERGDVNIDTVNDWKKRLPNLCEGFEDKDIFNMDESGLFYRDTTRKTFRLKSEDCAGGKRSKERITIAFCASMKGEKLKPVLIGKSRQPRCFGKINTKTLPVHYYFNKKAWMTSVIYEDYLRTLNRKMRSENRNILLFVDNAPVHPKLQFSNIKVQFLPPNTTCYTQPMDQGIIQACKLKFRKRQLMYMTKEMDRRPSLSGTDLLKQISILDTIYWVKNSWEEVEESTIQKCFTKSGFGVSTETEATNDLQSDNCDSDDDDDADDNIPLATLRLSNDLFGCHFHDLAQVDENLQTYDAGELDSQDPHEILKTLSSDCANPDELSDDDEDVVCPSESTESVSLCDAVEMVRKLKHFAVKSGNSQLMDSLCNVDEQLTEISVQKTKQTKIDDFFINKTRPV